MKNLPQKSSYEQEILDEDIRRPTRYSLTVAIGAKCVELKRKLGKQPAKLKNIKRGEVQTYSRQSRNNFLKTLLSIDYSVMGKPAFLTLTYPGEYSEDARIWKDDLHLFIVRLRKEFRSACGTWKIEPQKRGAPHYHLFLWNGPDLTTMKGKAWLSRVWFEVVGSGDKKHLSAGTSVQTEINTIKEIYYMAKYQTKNEKGTKSEIFEYKIGRYWGMFGRKNIRISHEEMEIPKNLYFKIRRVLRKKLEKRTTKTRYKEIMRGSQAGLWAEVSEKTILRLVNKIIDDEERGEPPREEKLNVKQMSEYEEWEQEQIMKRYERKQKRRTEKKGADGERVERAQATQRENSLIWALKN